MREGEGRWTGFDGTAACTGPYGSPGPDRPRSSPTIVFLGIVVQESWAGNPITWDSILFFLIVGVTFGSVYAVAADGLVVTYTTSGIFNFAQGAIGMFGAFIFWKLHVDLGHADASSRSC